METNNSWDKKFLESCFTLSEEQILEFALSDNNVPLNNVVRMINKECFFATLQQKHEDYIVEMFYVNNAYNLKGDVLVLELSDPDYNSLLLKFCFMISVTYEEVYALKSFNTFQLQLRGGLEKLGFMTVTTLELKQFEGKSISIMTKSEKGIKVIKLYDEVDFYRKWFDNYGTPTNKANTYIYLMVNTDTSLIKIGTSNNPQYRESTLHSKEPSVYLIACWENIKSIEKELHQKYKHKRERGEWFRLDFAELDEIKKFMIIRAK